MGVDESMTQAQIFDAFRNYQGKNTSRLYQSLFSANNKWLREDTTIESLDANEKVIQVRAKKLSPI
jgi:hypothetical protein